MIWYLRWQILWTVRKLCDWALCLCLKWWFGSFKVKLLITVILFQTPTSCSSYFSISIQLDCLGKKIRGLKSCQILMAGNTAKGNVLRRHTGSLFMRNGLIDFKRENILLLISHLGAGKEAMVWEFLTSPDTAQRLFINFIYFYPTGKHFTMCHLYELCGKLDLFNCYWGGFVSCCDRVAMVSCTKRYSQTWCFMGSGLVINTLQSK